MNLSKIAAVVVASCLTAGAVVDASAAIGRASTTTSSARSSSSSYSAATSPTRVGGVGGTSSIGVRKPTITQPVASQIQQQRQPAAVNSSSSTYRAQPQYSSGYNNSNYNQQPNYNNSSNYNNSNYNHPQSNSTGPSAVGTFAAAAGGSLVGSAVGNALFNNHNATPSTTIVNNGAPAAVPVTQSATVAQAPAIIDPVTGNVTAMPGTAVVQQVPQLPAAQVVQQQKGYGLFSLISDMLGFVIVAALALAIVFGGYMVFKRSKKFIEQEKQEAAEVHAAEIAQPFAPVSKFWTIQRAFSDADVVALKAQLGPDVVDELTANIEPTAIQISNVSSDILHLTSTEFSVHYKFTDNNEQIDQVWHYEVHDGQWKLNGIENL